MDYKEKYEMALERAKMEMSKDGMKNDVIARHLAETIFPELKESEDEKVEKAIFGMVYDSDNELWSSYGVTKSDVLAWLEKQGNPADNAESKFKVGDWVVRGGTIAQILDIQEQYYVGLDINGKDFTSSRFLNDNKIHLWTIQDAKDGDVLQLGEVTAIFQKYIGDGNCKCYCSVYDGEFEIPNKDSSYGCHNAIPATKEQRDTLMKAMTDAGYTFDFERKKLEKIQDEEYNDEDYGIDGLYHAQRILEKTIGKVDGYQSDDGILEHKCAITAVKKLYEHKPTNWSEEDESILQGIWDEILANKHDAKECEWKTYDKFLNWLKSLRPQK